MKTLTSPLRVLTLGALLAAATSASAVEYYKQTFTNTGTDVNASTVSWFGFSNNGASGVVAATSTSDTTANNVVPLIGNATGKDVATGLASLNLAANTQTTKQALFYTSAANFNTGYTAATFGSLTSASWWLGNTTTSATQQLAIQLGSQWYVSTTSVSSAAVQFASGFAGSANQATINFGTETWTKLNFTAGTTAFSFGTGGDTGITASALQAETVTAIGIFGADTAGSRLRYDSFLLDGVASVVPEPSAYAVLVGLAGLGFAVSRRRRAA